MNKKAIVAIIICISFFYAGVLPIVIGNEDEFSLDFTYLPSATLKDDKIFFTGLCDTEVKSWWWDFGDGYYSDLQNPVHIFYEDGIYPVKLSVETENGEVKTILKVVYIPAIMPSADFSYSPPEPFVTQEIQFNDSSIGSAQAWHWNFGDGTISNLINPAHSYTNEGTYNVSLTISGFGTDTIIKPVQVSNPPEQIDQTQEVFHTGDSFTICNYIAQSFVPTLPILTKVDVILRRGDINKDVKVLIKKNLMGEILSLKIIPGNQIPSNYGWVTFDFDDIPLNPGDVYFIVVTTNSYNWAIPFYYGRSYFNSYDDGFLYSTRHCGSKWDEIYQCRDMCFRTYGKTL